jgi:hypothetical protein
MDFGNLKVVFYCLGYENAIQVGIVAKALCLSNAIAKHGQKL